MPEIDAELFLQAEDIKPETTVIITDAGGPGQIPGKGDEESTPTFEIGIELPNHQRRSWSMNKTSQRAIATVYGSNTDDWVGKKVVLFTSMQNVRGTMRDVIYARKPVKEVMPNVNQTERPKETQVK